MSNIVNLKNKILELGISPNKTLGQNFLINENIINRIISETQKSKYLNVIEIGPGLGALTDHLIALKFKKLILIELDNKIKGYWELKKESSTDDFEVIHKDALKVDWSQFESLGEFIIVSNLPYQISSSILIDRSFDPSNLKEMILMFQKEVGQRIQSPPNSKDYGILSVIAQLFWNIEKVCDVGFKDFYPPPKIASVVLKFKKKGSNLNKDFLNFVKTSFSQRRKTLINNLKEYDNLKVIKFLEIKKLDSKVRPENLSPQNFEDLFKVLLNNDYE